jgi:hypothetical protein
VERAYKGKVYDRVDKEGPPQTERMPGPMAKVRVGGGVTRNMGDYESVRCHVEIEMPCVPEWDSVNEMYAELSNYVYDRLADEVALATGIPRE